jgi:hypothetical protein
MTGQERRSRLDELWTRWLGDAPLEPGEQLELAAALAEDAPAREELLADQRIEGALCALGRSHDGAAFARRFQERVSAEGDDRAFVSSFERRMRSAGLPPVHKAISRARVLRAAGLLLLPAAAALLVLVWRRAPPAPAPSSPAPLAFPSVPRVRDVPAHHPAVPGVVARVDRVTGTAFILDNARKAPAQTGTWIRSGMGVVTVGRDSRAVLVFPDRTSFELSGNTALVQIAEGGAPGALDRAKQAFLARGRLVADVTAQPAGLPMLITTPHGEATVVGTRFALTVEVRSTRLDVEQGAVELGRLSGGAPVVVRSGEYALVNEGNDPAVISNPRGTAMLVVGSLMLTPGDDRIKKRLETLGFDVHVRGSGPPDPEELRRVAVVLLSSSIFSLDVNTQFRDVAAPIVVWEPSLFDDLGMTGPEENGDCGVTASTGEGVIKDPSHPLAAGMSGLVQLIAPNRDRAGRARKIDMSFGTPGPQAAWVATWPGRPTRAVLFAYDKGLALPGLAAAPARRVGLFLYDRSPPQLTEAGWATFDAAVLWAAQPR